MLLADRIHEASPWLRTDIRMDHVPFEPSLSSETGLFKSARRSAVFNIAGRLYAKERWNSDCRSSECCNGLRHEPAAPVAARQDVTNVQGVQLQARLQHADWRLLVLGKGKDKREADAGTPCTNAFRDESLGFGQCGMRPPNHVASDLGILRVRSEQARGIRCARLAQDQALRLDAPWKLGAHTLP